MRRLLPALLAACCACARPAQPKNVLFVGNSFTGYNDLAGLVKKISLSQAAPLETARVLQLAADAAAGPGA